MADLITIVAFLIVVISSISKAKLKKTDRKPVSVSTAPSSGKPVPARQKSQSVQSARPNRQSVRSTPQDRKPQPVRQEPSAERSFVQPSAPYRPSRNAGERYDDWFPIPKGKTVVRCSYCGADNLIPDKGNPRQFSCYFCREEL